jgi:hypothetical protein
MIQGQIYIEKESLGLKGAISNSRIFTLGETRELFNLEVVGARHDTTTASRAPPCSYAMIQGQIYIEKESLGLKGAISNSRIFTLGQTREIFNLEVVGARA